MASSIFSVEISKLFLLSAQIGGSQKSLLLKSFLYSNSPLYSSKRTSFGISMSTGHGRPSKAMNIALDTSFIISSTFLTHLEYFVHFFTISTISIS